jgi:hypothetical protein
MAHAAAARHEGIKMPTPKVSNHHGSHPAATAAARGGKSW